MHEDFLQLAPENRPSQKVNSIFQPSIFRFELLVSGRVHPFIDEKLRRDFGVNNTTYVKTTLKR